MDATQQLRQMLIKYAAIPLVRPVGQYLQSTTADAGTWMRGITWPIRAPVSILDRLGSAAGRSTGRTLAQLELAGTDEYVYGADVPSGTADAIRKEEEIALMRKEIERLKRLTRIKYLEMTKEKEQAHKAIRSPFI